MSDSHPPTTEETAAHCLASLREALERLAAPADDQIAWLRSGGGHPDELALELYDALVIAWAALETGALTADVVAAAQSVSEGLGAMSGQANAELWTDTGLRTSKRWAEVRGLAANVLTDWPPS